AYGWYLHDADGVTFSGIVAYLLAQRRTGAVRRLVQEDVRAPVPLDPPRPPAERPAGELPFDSEVVHQPHPAGSGRAARRSDRAAQVTVDAGHLVHESRPEEFLTVVREFLDR
ncbi:alpha/beta fold hydrolase, partial [Streptomyces sp. NPDC003233]